ncbi:glucose-1-phosphate adenylyltransferase [Thiohalospira halophila DSM 15071]|uniref:Glucose-1-phosphate adenylyltransferase n=1 Tax=Thiohalospira halophila DSM 15071 TaxID=1123397 RepID=A0A1I1NWN2_9GAMM|nr:glucose-1-phosphate adenylyltransferase [Thiohalospira halophila DSM 15071]
MLSNRSPRFVSRLTRDTLALVLAGGRGSRLRHLTMWRAKPAVPFGGKFRIVDFPLSNCINSGIRRIGVITQYKAHSLIRHLRQGWGSLRGEFGEFVELLPAQQRIETSWYKGTADAIYQNLDIIQMHSPEYVLILAGDHVYKMDYGPMLAHHAENEADVTVGCLEVPVEEASAFGVMATDEAGRVVRFEEKPANPTPTPGNPGMALVSMGIYIFNRQFLFDQLIRDADADSDHDFGKDIIPRILESARVMAYPFREASTGRQAYWRDVGTVDSFWRANLELVDITPELNIYDDEWPIWTYQEQLPPAKFIFDDEDRRGMAVDSMVSGGCIISGGYVRRSLLFSSVMVEAGSQVESSVILPEVRVEPGCRITNAVIEKHCRIPSGTVIGEDPQADAERFHVSPGGVTLVTPEMLGQGVHHVR